MIPSSAPNGSSSSIAGRPVSTVRRNAARCRMPPDSCHGQARANSPRPKRSSSGSARRRASSRGTPASSSPSVVLSSTRRQGSRPSRCGMKAQAPSRSSRGSPSMQHLAGVGSSRPARMWKRVLLPQPLGPRMATSSPGSATRSTPSRATTSLPVGSRDTSCEAAHLEPRAGAHRGPPRVGGRTPRHREPLDQRDEAEQQQRQRGRHEHGAEDEIGAEGVLRRRHVDAEPLLGADELGDRGGHVGVRHGHLEAREELRQRARQPHAPEQLPLRRAHGAQQADGVAVGRREALHEPHGDGEEGEEGDEADLGALAEAEPDDHERREGDDRQGLRGDDQRVDGAPRRGPGVDRRWPRRRRRRSPRRGRGSPPGSWSPSPARGSSGRPTSTPAPGAAPGSMVSDVSSRRTARSHTTTSSTTTSTGGHSLRRRETIRL